jgi:hypothetical protein
MVTGLEAIFPGLQGKPYRVTSPRALDYNCIAWAVQDTLNWWWPDEDQEDTWPAGVTRTETIDAFRDAFATFGYQVCDHAQLEPGFDKLALFADASGTPKHAARQLPSGLWTSKLGRLEDIEHELHDLAGTEYGSVVLVMKRPVAPESACGSTTA